MAAKGYTDKTAIENYMLVDIDASFDDQIDEYIETVEEYIDHATNRDFAPYDGETAASERTFDGDGTKTILIDPATTVTAVKLSEDGDAIAADQYITMPVRKETIEGIKMKYLVFPTGLQNIYITATWGYASVPKQVKMAATILVSGIIQNAWQAEGEIQSISLGRYQVTYRSVEEVAAKHPEVEEMLQAVKRFAF